MRNLNARSPCALAHNMESVNLFEVNSYKNYRISCSMSPSRRAEMPSSGLIHVGADSADSAVGRQQVTLGGGYADASMAPATADRRAFLPAGSGGGSACGPVTRPALPR